MLRRALTLSVPAALLVTTLVTCDLFNRHATTRFDIGTSALDVFAFNDTLLVVAEDSGVLVYDISDARTPRWLFRVGLAGCRCIIARDGLAYIGTDNGVVVRDLAHATGDRLQCGGSSQVVTGLAADSDYLYAATGGGVTAFRRTSPNSVKFVAVSGEPTGLARRDSRLFVSLRDWGVRVFNIHPGESLELVLDTIHLGRHNRAEGVTVTPGGYCIISQGDSGVMAIYAPTPDSVGLHGGGGAGGSGAASYATAATGGGQDVSIYVADSSTVTFCRLRHGPSGGSFSGELGPDLEGFTRRICRGNNGYVYTASGDAGVYIIRE
jgi:hypothetical protein